MSQKFFFLGQQLKTIKDNFLLFAVLLYVVQAQRDDFEDDVNDDFLPIGFLIFVCHNDLGFNC